MPQPSIPIEFSDLKQRARSGLDSQESRQFWWPLFPSLSASVKTIDEVPDTISIAEQLTKLLKEPLLDQNAPSNRNEALSEQMVRKVSYVLINQNKLDDVEMSYFLPLLRLIMWQMNRVDVGYYLATEIISNPDRYGRPGPSSAFAAFHSFRELLRKYMPHTFSALKTIGAVDDKYLSMMFVDFFVELLPSHILLPMLDAYFLEGVKILYRYGLALVAGYKTAIKSGEFSTAKEFWLAVKSDSFAVTSFTGGTAVMKVLPFDEVLPTVDQFVVFEHAKNQDYLNSNELKVAAYDTERSFLQKVSKPMKVSRSNLSSLKKQASALEPPGLKHSMAHRQSVIQNRSTSLTGKMMEGTSGAQALSRKQSLRGPPGLQRNASMTSTSNNNSPLPSPMREEADSMLIHPATLIASHSTILDVSSAEKLLSCLQKPFNSAQYELRFATYQAGWDLSSLYTRIERYENCIFLIQLAAPYDDIVIGAFNRGPLSPPNQQVVRGEGRSSRIFRLEETQAVQYQWVNYEKTDEELEEMKISASNPSNQFAVSSTSALWFGSSAKEACSAIRLDTDLAKVYLGPSDTYDNPPLLVNNEQSLVSSSVVQTFDVKEIEVFCASANRHVLKD